MGVEIEAAVNAKVRGSEAVISTPESKVKVVVIPTDEEYMIARDTEAIVEGRENKLIFNYIAIRIKRAQQIKTLRPVLYKHH